MPELATIYAELLDGAISAVAKAEARHLAAHVKQLAALNGKPAGTDDALKAFEAGWLPDYFLGSEIAVSAQLTMSTARERKLTASGGVEFGPLRLEGGLAETFQQGTSTNLSISTTLVRQSRSKGLEYALAALTVQPVTPAPVNK